MDRRQTFDRAGNVAGDASRGIIGGVVKKTVSTRDAQRLAASLSRETRRLAWIERGSSERALRLVGSTQEVDQAEPLPFRFDMENRPRAHARVLGALWTFQDATRARNIITEALEPLKDDGSPFITPIGGFLLRVRDQLSIERRTKLQDHIDLLLDVVEDDEFQHATDLITKVRSRAAPEPHELWNWYEREAASIYALLEMATYQRANRANILRRAHQVLSLKMIDVPDATIRTIGSTTRTTIAATKLTVKLITTIIEEVRTPDQQQSLPGQPTIASGAAQHGFMPKRLAALVEQHPLETEGLDVQLRGYQAFGARYALHQRRVLLGDEMGLGKTIVALAVMQHLANVDGAERFFVVAPNSVLHNWAHEVTDRTSFPVHILHGSGLSRKFNTWQRQGGVAITTFGTAGNIPFHDDAAQLVIVDEAHYVKNPNAQRTQAVSTTLECTDYVLFMTGTPMENRLIEFQRLAYLIDPEKVQHLTGLHQWNSELFRAAAAPIYLRRNQEDVLPELPELIEIDEWVSFTRDDHLRFEGALERSGNFIPLRYAAFPNGHSGGNSAKLERLVALVEEAVEDGLKVAVYSEYHATIDAVVSALRNIGCPTFGPITGAVPPPQRLALIKELAEHTGGAALVSQIQAGGIGLNIQAASVVILCEPAIKPSIEVQAIARSFRMGQTRVVRVHRLLTEEGIDQRIRQLLSTKQAEFDTYVRHSSIAENSAAAMERDVVGSLTAYAAQEAAARGIAS